ncbi:MAG: isopentenyl-diphosphate Delta-isomerase [Candidatus Micrarchaeota archaeon]|nr:isopentenyl-diphosphate Delta-isomerase [Candidatus Micrarchaeota archaeon]MDE1847396.1 isopentenyl-diphosphate Delta-isomerase [Candidatus Micrarchaeota archaeon]MDE1864011.1 isopentenyl-diphosphate Delta-isomerase [Candidatus Micrarchaeota archaeon]
MPSDEQIDVILVDDKDNQIGTMEKIAAHSNGARLHRAFSIFVFNSNGETLLQRRAMGKYHSKGFWSNTCCSHPYVGESNADAAHRRLKEEFGFDCKLDEKFSFIYRTDVGEGLTEHEFDHVFTGTYDGDVSPNPEEIMDYKWADPIELIRDMDQNPKSYTLWSMIGLERILREREKHN